MLGKQWLDVQSSCPSRDTWVCFASIDSTGWTEWSPGIPTSPHLPLALQAALLSYSLSDSKKVATYVSPHSVPCFTSLPLPLYPTIDPSPSSSTSRFVSAADTRRTPSGLRSGWDARDQIPAVSVVRAGGKVDGTSSRDHIELTISDQPSPLHNNNTSRDNIQNDSRMLEISMEAILAIKRLTPRIVSCAASRPVRWEGSTTPHLCALIVRPEVLW